MPWGSGDGTIGLEIPVVALYLDEIETGRELDTT